MGIEGDVNIESSSFSIEHRLYVICKEIVNCFVIFMIESESISDCKSTLIIFAFNDCIPIDDREFDEIDDPIDLLFIELIEDVDKLELIELRENGEFDDRVI